VFNNPILWGILCGFTLSSALFGAMQQNLPLLAVGFVGSIVNYIVATGYQRDLFALANTLRTIYEYTEERDERVIISFDNGEHKVEFYRK